MKNSNYWCKVRWNPVTRVQKIPTWLFWFSSIIIIFLTNKFSNKIEDMIVAGWSAACLAGGLRVGVTDNATGGHCDATVFRQLSLHSGPTPVKQSKVCFVGSWSNIAPVQGSISIATVLPIAPQYWQSAVGTEYCRRSVLAPRHSQERERFPQWGGRHRTVDRWQCGGAGLQCLCFLCLCQSRAQDMIARGQAGW